MTSVLLTFKLFKFCKDFCNEMYLWCSPQKSKSGESRHSGESRNPGFPVKTGIQSLRCFPAFGGTTSGLRFPPEWRLFTRSPSLLVVAIHVLHWFFLISLWSLCPLSLKFFGLLTFKLFKFCKDFCNEFYLCLSLVIHVPHCLLLISLWTLCPLWQNDFRI